MTEDEAMRKWCPFSRVVLSERDEDGNEVGHIIANRAQEIGSVPKNSKCISSSCMMWRYTNEVTGRGYCGLAGKP